MRAVGLIAAAVALAAPAPVQSAASPTGLHGFVRRGLIMPVCFEGIPCDEPAAGVVLVFTRAGADATRVKTNQNGFYRVRLAGGRYTVKTATPREPQPAPARASVRVGQDARLDFYIDTGLQ